MGLAHCSGTQVFYPVSVRSRPDTAMAGAAIEECAVAREAQVPPAPVQTVTPAALPG